jgi:hypothetical protein
MYKFVITLGVNSISEREELPRQRQIRSGQKWCDLKTDTRRTDGVVGDGKRKEVILKAKRGTLAMSELNLTNHRILH